MRNNKKGFTLIELMVVIVIIGILSALAIPKMFGVSAKAKAAEAPGVIANWEVLNSAYAQETGAGGTATQIGFVTPNSMWFTPPVPTATNITYAVAAMITFGSCTGGTDDWQSDFDAPTDTYTHVPPTTAGCAGYTPNF